MMKSVRMGNAPSFAIAMLKVKASNTDMVSWIYSGSGSVTIKTKGVHFLVIAVHFVHFHLDKNFRVFGKPPKCFLFYLHDYLVFFDNFGV